MKNLASRTINNHSDPILPLLTINVGLNPRDPRGPSLAIADVPRLGVVPGHTGHEKLATRWCFFGVLTSGNQQEKWNYTGTVYIRDIYIIYIYRIYGGYIYKGGYPEYMEYVDMMDIHQHLHDGKQELYI